MLLRKLGLSKKFPRRILYSRKSALGVGLLALRIIVNTLALKLYIRHQRADDRIGKIIQINEENMQMQYGYSKSIIEMERESKPKKIIWSDKIQQKLCRRKLRLINRMNEVNYITKNKTIMDLVFM